MAVKEYKISQLIKYYNDREDFALTESKSGSKIVYWCYYGMLIEFTFLD